MGYGVSTIAPALPRARPHGARPLRALLPAHHSLQGWGDEIAPGAQRPAAQAVAVARAAGMQQIGHQIDAHFAW
jgi:hypothetical protein